MLLSNGQTHPSAIPLLKNVPPAERQTGQMFSIASIIKRVNTVL